MKRFLVFVLTAGLCVNAFAQIKDPEAIRSELFDSLNKVDSASVKILSLEDVIKITLSENTTIKIADMEINRVGYAKKGTYAALYPQIDVVGSFQRTIEKQVMYMDGGNGGGIASSIMSSIVPYLQPLYAQHPDISMPEPQPSSGSSDGIAVGRWNTWSAGVTLAMPLVNAQLWKNLKISGEEVDLAIEKARNSRLEAVKSVKQMYYTVLMAKDSYNVYLKVFENANTNYETTLKKYNAQKSSELDLNRAATTLANSIPNVYDSESAVILALWQLKALMGISLDEDIDIKGCLSDYSTQMLIDEQAIEMDDLSRNSSMKQLAIQAEELANMVKVQKAAYIPTLSLAFNYNLNAMTNDFNFAEYKWTPYSYVGLSLNIPIFSGFRRLNQVRQAKVQSAELDLQRIETERQLKISIRQDLNLIETAIKSINSAQIAVKTASKAYDIAQKSYDIGRGTLVELNQSQVALVEAQLSVSQAIFSFLSAKASLENTLGAEYIEN